jgi:uncharacterized protein with NAD-binding domain and iron-sulfur cluster
MTNHVIVLLLLLLLPAAEAFLPMRPPSVDLDIGATALSPSFVIAASSRTSTRSTFTLQMSSSSSNNDEPNEVELSSEEQQQEGEEGREKESESAALEWARAQVEEMEEELKRKVDASADAAAAAAARSDGKKKFVVIGAGWGGWGAAKALCQSGAASSVTILDAIPDPTGRTPSLSATGKPVEAGTRGFWMDYPNINKLCAELGLAEDTVFTEFTNSSFYGPDGLEATAPVFSKAEFPVSQLPFLSQFAGQKLPNLPSPLGQVLATFPLFERIPLADRASMVGLLVATVDCLGSDESVQAAYDRMTAHELFVRFKLSDRLVQDFIKPTLLVGLFKPPEELSALVVMELLYYYALAHTDSFDVRWIKNGTVADSLTAPLAAMLEKDYDLDIRGGCRVKTISTMPFAGQHRVSTVEYIDANGDAQSIQDVDGVVLAVTSKGMNAIVGNSPDLARYPVFSKAASCAGIDVISVRLWLDKTVPTRTPANVLSRFDELRGAGGTFFMLDQLQSDNLKELWGGAEPRGSVVACDFYNAGALLALPDDDLVRTLMRDLLPAAVPAFADAVVVDSWVGKYPGAVSWFAPGSFDKRPPLEGAGRDQIDNLKCAGDWVRMGEREHGAKGLCQERAYVTGLEAANALLRDTGSSGSRHAVIPVREDEAQFRAAVAVNQQVMKFLPRFWVR